MAPIIRTCSLIAALALMPGLAGSALAQSGPLAVAQDSRSDDLRAYVRARAADAAGEADIAAAGYARALAAAPDDAMVALRAYRQALAAGDYDVASRAAAVLVRAGVAPPDTAVLAFAIALEAGDMRGAQAGIARMRSGPLDFLVPSLSAWIAQETSGDGVAQIDVQPGSALSRRFNARTRALLLLAQGRTREGLAALAPILSLMRDDDGLRIDAAQLLAARGEKREARALFDAPLPARKPVGAAFGASRLFLALAHDISGDEMQTLTILLARAALLLDPGEERARLALADALSASGADVQALAALDGVRPENPWAHDAAATRVTVLERAGRSDAALAAARVLAEGPGVRIDDALAYGDLLDAAGRHAAAAAAYGVALALPGGDARWTLHFRQGRALDRAGDWAEAEAALRRAAALEPEESAPLEYLGTAKLARGDMAEAQALLERARALAPRDSGIADSLGLAYLQRGDMTRALPMLEAAVQSDPSGALPNEHLGDAYWRLGRRYEARYAWQAASVYADSDAAQRIAAKLANGLKGNN